MPLCAEGGRAACEMRTDCVGIGRVVIWSVSRAPAQGQRYLGKAGAQGENGEHIFLERPQRRLGRRT